MNPFVTRCDDSAHSIPAFRMLAEDAVRPALEVVVEHRREEREDHGEPDEIDENRQENDTQR